MMLPRFIAIGISLMGLGMSTSFFVGCKKIFKTPTTESAPQQYFRNSRRSHATANDRRGIARVKRLDTDKKCTGFFLKSSTTKTFLATAKHCLYSLPDDANASDATTRNPQFWDIDRWCSRGGTAEDVETGATGGCKQGGLRVGDSSHDFAIIEMNISRAPGANQDLFGSFRLADFTPAATTPITMLGYPDDISDPSLGCEANECLVKTDNCWVVNVDDNSLRSTYANGDLSRKARHNCTTQFGNSGGPMVMEGTPGVVMGLPASYRQGDNVQHFPDENLLPMNLLGEFIAAHRDQLSEIQIVSTAPRSRLAATYFAHGLYVSKDSQCTLDVIPFYESNTKPEFILVTYRPTGSSTCSGTQIFACEDVGSASSSISASFYKYICTANNPSRPENPQSVLKIIRMLNDFEYIDGNAAAVKFSRQR